ncbi:MAG: TonB-dependent receptor [Candidatus Hydrogenedentota bacterium]
MGDYPIENPGRARIPRCRTCCISVFLYLLQAVSPAFAQDSSRPSNELLELTHLSIEELMDIDVEIAAKHAEPLHEASAAVFVITSDDIRRSGMRSIPELLRLVPGMQVARIDANMWAISSRGFNDRFANKLLVLIDGRSVYTPLFSGVWWDVQSVPVENIERIEVVRGPGGSLWGSNAVNGVINIITKSSAETLGGLVTAGGGSAEGANGHLRYGGRLGANGTWRAYAERIDVRNGEDGRGRRTRDEWNGEKGGFRSDWNLTERDEFTFQGDIYDISDKSDPFRGPTLSAPFSRLIENDQRARGGNVAGHWTRTFESAARLQMRGYYDRTERRTGVVAERRDLFDLELQHDLAPIGIHHFTWGAGYRYTRDHLDNTFDLSFSPAERNDDLKHGFIQDEIHLRPETLRLTLGTKVEENDYTGFEIQPTARLLWQPAERHVFWSAVSRAVRIPSRALEDVRVNIAASPVPSPPFAAPVVLQSFFGNRDVKSEDLLSFEAGYRGRVGEQGSVDLAGFYNVYDNLATNEVKAMTLEAPTHLVVPVVAENRMDGEVYGGEAVVNWDVSPRWRLRGSYSLLLMQLHQQPGSTAVNPENQEGNVPQQQFQIRSYLDLPRNISLDWGAYFVDNLRTQRIPHYLRFDARLAWQPRSGLELSLIGQNLLDASHREFGTGVFGFFTSPVEIRRNIAGQVTWMF